MKKIILFILLFSIVSLTAESTMKKAFSEGMKASLKVVEYEKKQALDPIPKGYCGMVMKHKGTLKAWEELKLESLALNLNLTPSLFEAKIEGKKVKRVLCFIISKDKEEVLTKLKEIEQRYPKINQYLTKVEILPTDSMHRVIPGVGQYFEDMSDEIKRLKKALQPDSVVQVSKEAKIIVFQKKQKGKVLYETEHTIVVGSDIFKVFFIEHKMTRERS